MKNTNFAKNVYRTGFTLAEVLLTLAVIGIVAAITLPSLLVDTTEKAFDTQKRALHARLAQAIGMMSSLSGYGQYIPDSKDNDGNTVQGKDDAAETFLYEGLSKVYKINNICDSDNLDKCGMPSSITKMNGESMVFPKKLSELNPLLITNGREHSSDKQTTDTKVAAFETVNGESIAVFYNPNCRSDKVLTPNTVDGHPEWGNYYFSQNRMCANFIYDLNGTKGPNKVGRDIGFITALYAKNSEVVAPVPFETDIDEELHPQQEAVELCINYADDARLPNRDELASLFFNKDLTGNIKLRSYWSSSVISKDRGWAIGFHEGTQGGHQRTVNNYVRCVRK